MNLNSMKGRLYKFEFREGAAKQLQFWPVSNAWVLSAYRPKRLNNREKMQKKKSLS